MLLQAYLATLCSILTLWHLLKNDKTFYIYENEELSGAIAKYNEFLFVC